MIHKKCGEDTTILLTVHAELNIGYDNSPHEYSKCAESWNTRVYRKETIGQECLIHVLDIIVRSVDRAMWSMVSVLFMDGLLASYTDRILPLDAQAARLAGQISDAAIAQGCHPGFADIAIAALAQNAGLLLLTCNLKHFQPLGVACADPLIALPPE